MQAGGQEFDSPHLHHFTQLHAPDEFFSDTCVPMYAAVEKKIRHARKSARNTRFRKKCVAKPARSAEQEIYQYFTCTLKTKQSNLFERIGSTR